MVVELPFSTTYQDRCSLTNVLTLFVLIPIVTGGFYRKSSDNKSI